MPSPFRWPSSGPRRPIHSAPPVAFLAAALLVASAAMAAAQELPGYTRVEPPRRARAAETLPPPLAGAPNGLDPLFSASAAAAEDEGRLAALREHNAAGAGRIMNGFVRGTADRLVRIGSDLRALEGSDWRLQILGDTAVWAASVSIEEAWALRLELVDVDLPPGARLWISSPSRPEFLAGPFTADEVAEDGTLWLPPAPGPEVVIEVRADVDELLRGDQAVVTLRLGRVAELFDTAPTPENLADAPEAVCAPDGRGTGPSTWLACKVDATCVSPGTLPPVANLREAVALLFFMEDGISYSCSGALLADQWQTGIPYLLTANHCFATQAAASSLTSYFDYRSDTCNGSAPDLLSVPRVNGSTLLATSDLSDFTMVQLSTNPAGTNHYLGWTAQPPEAGEIVHRVAHPAAMPQHYLSTTFFEGNNGIGCAVRPRDRFHYGTRLEGSSTGGASGGPAIVGRNGGLLVGQTYGYCFFQPGADLCDGSTFDQMEGSFETTHFHVSPWLGNFTPSEIFADGYESGDLSAWSSAAP